MGQVRIIGGKYRSRILKFKDNIDGLRPTTDRIRETLFNWLGQDLTGKRCLDLFAGSGALGFEALSRNAVAVTMVEVDKTVIQDLKTNKELLNAVNLNVVRSNGLDYLKRMDGKINVLFLDPPYATTLLKQSLDLLIELKDKFKDVIIYIEYAQLPDLTVFEILKQSKAGAVHYALIKIK